MSLSGKERCRDKSNNHAEYSDSVTDIVDYDEKKEVQKICVKLSTFLRERGRLYLMST